MQNVDTSGSQGLGAVIKRQRQACGCYKARREVPDRERPQDWISDDGWLTMHTRTEPLVDQSIVRDALATLDGRAGLDIHVVLCHNEPTMRH